MFSKHCISTADASSLIFEFYRREVRQDIFSAGF